MIILWLSILGGCIGSFLNVVIFRLPAGKSLSVPGSQCPKCNHPIRWFDNIPVISWVILRAKCRDCGAGISARYPLVEFITAALFCIVALSDFNTSSINSLKGFSERQLIGCYLFHLCLPVTLIATILIEFDGHRVPVKLFGPMLALGIGAPILRPFLISGPGIGGFNAKNLLAGIVVIACFSIVSSPLLRKNKLPPYIRSSIAIHYSLVTTYLGWTAVSVIAPIHSCLFLVFTFFFRGSTKWNQVPWSAFLFPLSLSWLTAGEQLLSLVPEKVEQSRILFIIGACVITFFVSQIAWMLFPKTAK